MSLEIYVGDFSELQTLVLPVREAVFVVEQGVPAEIERDARDPDCRHAVGLQDQRAVATGRLDPQYDRVNRVGKIGRLAVVSASRGQGIGSRILAALEAEAARLGLHSVTLHAQLAATAFYTGHGYQPATNATFLEAGIPHCKMIKPVSAKGAQRRGFASE